LTITVGPEHLIDEDVTLLVDQVRRPITSTSQAPGRSHRWRPRGNPGIGHQPIRMVKCPYPATGDEHRGMQRGLQEKVIVSPAGRGASATATSTRLADERASVVVADVGPGGR